MNSVETLLELLIIGQYVINYSSVYHLVCESSNLTFFYVLKRFAHTNIQMYIDEVNNKIL